MIGGHHGRSMPARGQRDQGIVLELSAFVDFPSFAISHLTDKPAGLPPIGRLWIPNDSCEAEQVVDPSPRRRTAGASSQFREDHSRVSDHESPSEIGQQGVVQPRLPVSDVDPRIEDGPVQS